MSALATVLFAAGAVAGCTPSGGSPSPSPSLSLRTVHDPSDAELRAVEQRIAALDGATGATLAFTPETFENGAVWEGHVTTDGTDKAAMVVLLEESWRVVWNASDLPPGLMVFDVVNPATGEGVGYADAGLATNPSGFDLVKIFGSRP